jgi:hypothetical protein
MKPGRELDALIAEKVFGHPVERDERGVLSIGPADWDWIRNEGHELMNPVPAYSEDIAAAWEVVQKVWGAAWFRLERTDKYPEATPVWDAGEITYSMGENGIHNPVEGETAPHAICLAALKAVQE